MRDERYLPEEREDRFEDVLTRQISAGVEDAFRDHPNETWFTIFSAGTVLCLIGSIFTGIKVFGKCA